MSRILLPLFFFFSFFLLSSSSSIWYVNPASTATSPDGKSWATAFSDLQTALDITVTHDTVYVTGGTFKPTPGTNRSSTFYLKSYVSLYGGFIGNEKGTNQRVYPFQQTVLDGDIGTLGVSTDNSYHVVTLSNDNVLDGLVIQNGYADQEDYYYGSGGGIFMYSNSTTFVLSQSTLRYNYATQGGAIYVLGSTNKGITISDCYFLNNTAAAGTYRGGTGGAIHLVYNADTTISNSLFIDNVAVLRGGAIYVDYGTNLIVTNGTFTTNAASSGHGGAIFVEDRNSQFGSTSLKVTKSSFKSNSAPDGYGGAITTYIATGFNVSSTTFTSNKALYGGAITAYSTTWSSTLDCLGCTFTSNTASGNSTLNSYWIADPSIVTNVTYNKYNATYYLNSLYRQSQAVTTSLKQRQTASTIIYVNANSHVTKSQRLGVSWSKPFTSLQSAIDNASYCGSQCEIWVAAGVYTPEIVPSWSTTNKTTDRSIVMYNNVTMYGGFAGTETSRSQRNWYSNPTYIDGTVGLSGAKAQQILVSANNVLIDGFIFRHGYSATASGRRLIESNINGRRRLTADTIEGVLSDTSRIRGAGLFSNGTNTIVSNCLFYENYAYKGGGLYCLGGIDLSVASWPSLYNVAFVNNGAEVRGGGISADAYCNFYCEYCTFIGSFSEIKGGGIYLDYTSSPTIVHGTFTNNFASQAGGGIGIDGGGYLTVAYSTFTNNSASWDGGAIYSGSFNIEDNIPQTVNLTGVTYKNNLCKYGHNDLYIWSNAGLYVDGEAENGATSTPSPTPASSSANSKFNMFCNINKYYLIITLIFVLINM